MASGKGPLRTAIEDFLETFGLGRLILDGITTRITEETGTSILDIVDLMKRLQDGEEGATKDLQDYIGARFTDVPDNILGGVLYMWAILISIMPGGMAPFSRLVEYGYDKKARSWRPDPGLIQELRFRFPDLVKEWDEIGDELGIGDPLQDILQEASRTRTPEALLLALWRRGDLPEAELNTELAARGWDEENIQSFKAGTELRPAIQDIIRMAVREAFTPEIIEDFQLDAELPPRFLEEAEKLGMPKEFAERFWFAHWVLPSLGEGFRMFHRLRDPESPTHFSLDDLKTLIKTQDISPFFRDRLVEIAFRPLTRVDIRRMFRDGTLDRDQVLSAYRDLGFGEETADLMTDWTVKAARQSQKDLTRTNIIKGYKRKMFTRAEALEGLERIGYDEDEAGFFVAMADFEIAEALQDQVLDTVEFRFVEGIITQSQVFDEIGSLNLPAQQVEELLLVWNLKRQRKARLPTRGEIEDLYRRGIVEAVEVTDLMKARRYPERVIAWYVERLDEEIEMEALKELERAQKEQERVALAGQASAYVLARVSLDVEIAELRVAIADIALALRAIEDPDEIAGLKTLAVDRKLRIAERQLEKADLRLDFEETTSPEG